MTLADRAFGDLTTPEAGAYVAGAALATGLTRLLYPRIADATADVVVPHDGDGASEVPPVPSPPEPKRGS